MIELKGCIHFMCCLTMYCVDNVCDSILYIIVFIAVFRIGVSVRVRIRFFSFYHLPHPIQNCEECKH